MGEPEQVRLGRAATAVTWWSGRRGGGFPLAPAELARVEARDQRSSRTAATKVDFSTMKVEA
ncbi:MAG: hypothetical protein ACLTMP_12185 [Eggerthella lenta]